MAEHTHADDEVRFFASGSGIFYLHIDDEVCAVLGERGDLLSVPKGTTHWFDMGTRPDFTAVRFFRDQDGWVGEFTGDPIADRIPDFDTIGAARRAGSVDRDDLTATAVRPASHRPRAPSIGSRPTLTPFR